MVINSWNPEIESAGGARYITENEKTKANPKWPTNPQYLITFDRNIQMKIVLKKTSGRFTNELNKIGFMLTKPERRDEEGINIKQKTATASFGKVAGSTHFG